MSIETIARGRELLVQLSSTIGGRESLARFKIDCENFLAVVKDYFIVITEHGGDATYNFSTHQFEKLGPNVNPLLNRIQLKEKGSLVVETDYLKHKINIFCQRKAGANGMCLREFLFAKLSTNGTPSTDRLIKFLGKASAGPIKTAAEKAAKKAGNIAPAPGPAPAPAPKQHVVLAEPAPAPAPAPAPSQPIVPPLVPKQTAVVAPAPAPSPTGNDPLVDSEPASKPAPTAARPVLTKKSCWKSFCSGLSRLLKFIRDLFPCC